MTARAGEYSRLLVLLLRHTSTHLLYTNTHLPTQAISALREEHETITPCRGSRARARSQFEPAELEAAGERTNERTTVG